METFKENIKNLSKNKIYLILIGLAAIILATVLIYAYVEFLSDRISIVPNEEGKCGIENCHGLDITCGPNIPNVCTEIYMIGDGCRQYAKCEIINGKCQLVQNKKFEDCKSCVEKCSEDFSNDPIKLSQCAYKCAEAEEEQTCDAKCKSLNYKSGICRMSCNSMSGEVDMGHTSDCNPPCSPGMACPAVMYNCCCQGGEQCRDENYMCTTEDFPCCSGLKPVLLAHIKDGKCITLPCGNVCRPCGNGVCDTNENKCNCPEDCKEETGSITITSPNGGEELEKGRYYTIDWKSEQGIDIHDKLDIYLVDESKKSICTLNGKCCYTCSNWKRIITPLANFGFYSPWEVPIDQETGNKYKIYIRTLSDGNDCFKGCVKDESDNYFSIVEKKAHPCTDTDGGRDYYKKGTVTLRDISSNEILKEETDCCTGFDTATDCGPEYSDIMVIEYYCENNEIKSESHNCPNKCKDGACIGETLSADLNCDGNVNLTDVAILLSFWEKDPSEFTSCQSPNINQDGVIEESICSPCKNPDINQDGKVNLADFSIMMSQWTK